MPIEPILYEGKIVQSWLELMVRNHPVELPSLETQLRSVQVSSPSSQFIPP